MTIPAKLPLPGERNGLVSTESWMARLEQERAEHDAQRRDLQARNTELVEACRYSMRIVKALQPAATMDGYFLSRVWLLSQEKELQAFFDAVV
jgi:hypothetical protein